MVGDPASAIDNASYYGLQAKSRQLCQRRPSRGILVGFRTIVAMFHSNCERLYVCLGVWMWSDLARKTYRLTPVEAEKAEQRQIPAVGGRSVCRKASSGRARLG